MIDFEKFISLRKKKRLSQKELAAGICTQATLSHFENDGIVPSYKILAQLCQRLDIAVGDIFLNSNQSKIASNMLKAEYAYLNFDYSQIYNLLSEIENLEMPRKEDQLHFAYLNGIYFLGNMHDQVQALLYFKQILTDQKIDQYPIYYLLALKGCARSFELLHDNENAQNYYDRLARKINQVKIIDNLSGMQILSLYYRAGDFYGKQRQLKESNHLLNEAKRMASLDHLPYYMGRIFYRLGKNALAVDSLDAARRYFHDARSFSRFNHDQYILTKARQELKHIEE